MRLEDTAGSSSVAAVIRGKKIVLVFETLEVGGAERQGLLLAKQLQAEMGADVEIWGLGQPGSLVSLCEGAGIRWRIVATPWPFGRIQKIQSLVRLAVALRRAGADVILPYTMRPNVVCGSIWRWTGAKVCVWNQRDVGLQRLDRALERWAVARVPLFVSNSRAGLDFLVGTLHVPAQRATLIPNAAASSHPTDSRATSRQRLGVDERDFVACMLANFHEFKDHATLLRAWRLVVGRRAELGPRTVLLLAGRGDADALKRLAFDLKLCGVVRFLGYVSDVANLLAACDLGVLSSKREGMANALLESMAAGLPIVATDNPGNRETVGPEGYPYLAPIGDMEGLATRIEQFASDAAARAAIGAANRRRVTTEFSVDRMVYAMASVIARGLTDSEERRS